MITGESYNKIPWDEIHIWTREEDFLPFNNEKNSEITMPVVNDSIERIEKHRMIFVGEITD